MAAQRIGLGEDRHRLVEGGPLRLGGIEIPHDQHLQGHSDADAVLHALTDALLGGAALGDIGELFPDTDAANLGRDSVEMLGIAYRQVQAAGYRASNVDIVVHAERPKLAPFRAQIRARIAALLAIAEDRVSIKAKTGERLGPVGRGEAIDVRCVALLESHDQP